MGRSANDNLEQVFGKMAAFEAGASRAGVPTGSRREGDDFETLVRESWNALASQLVASGATAEHVAAGNRQFVAVRQSHRVLYLPVRETPRPEPVPEAKRLWFELAYEVGNLVDQFPGTPAAIRDFAPSAEDSSRYAGHQYPEIYRGLTTSFDDTIVLEERGALVEKILLEYKTAKSTRKGQIDGNAHERLSFQVLQYLEAAIRYPRCSFTVICNPAFVRYRNKYHVNFHVQAARLACFSWFSMRYLSTREGYRAFCQQLRAFLLDGVPLAYWPAASPRGR
jgi:hypothetical protein